MHKTSSTLFAHEYLATYNIPTHSSAQETGCPRSRLLKTLCIKSDTKPTKIICSRKYINVCSLNQLEVLQSNLNHSNFNYSNMTFMIKSFSSVPCVYKNITVIILTLNYLNVFAKSQLVTIIEVQWTVINRADLK